MIVWWLASAHASEVQGFVELRGTWAFGVDGDPWTLVQRVRPESEFDLAEGIVLGATIEASLAEGRSLQQELERTFSESDAAPMLAEAGCDWPTDANGTFHLDGPSDYLRVDRLFLDVYRPGVDVRIGRQALQWGSALMINPTDPFPQVLFTEPWRVRAGVNAVRATVPLGGRSNQVQLVAAANDALTAGRIAARGTVDIAGADISAVGAYRGDDQSGVIGVDVKGTLGVGYWFEGAVHVEDEPWEEFAVGVDYSFPLGESLIVGAQYYRNGGGEPDPDEYPISARPSQGLEGPTCNNPELTEAFGTGAADPFAPFVVGTDYGLAHLLWRALPDVTISAVGFQNLRDGSGIVVPGLTVQPTATLEIGATAQLPYRMWGRTGEFKPAPPELVMDVASGPAGDIEVDLNGLVPDATVGVWTKYAF